MKNFIEYCRVVGICIVGACWYCTIAISVWSGDMLRKYRRNV